MDHYPPDFLALQIDFATHVAAIAPITLAESLLRYTALARIIGLGWRVPSDDPVWLQFLATLDQGKDEAYHFYLERLPWIPRFEDEPHWGCFTFDYYPDQRAIHIHFGHADHSGQGPLSSVRVASRMTDLRAMFAHIHADGYDADTVHGGSWLYNRYEYRRLFPAPFIASAQPVAPHYRARALWGQFMRSDGQLSRDVADRFRANFAAAHDLADVPTCFPYPVLETVAPLQAFYTFYDV